jgi:TolB-like protein
LNDFLSELKRRNVFRVGVAYVVFAWLIAQVAELALDSFDAPGWVIKTILLMLSLGLPAVLFFAWAFEMTPEGLKKEKDVDRSQSITDQTGRKLNATIMIALVVAVSVLLFDKFALRSDAPAPAAEQAIAIDNSVAVLPFVDMSPAKDQEYFTDGLTENLLHALAQVQELKVAGRTSSFAFKGQNVDLREIGQQLNVSNILEGSVQKMGDRVRITTQLIETEGGYHLWSETFDRDLTDIFSVQDEIATAVANALRKNLLGQEEVSAGYSGNFEAYNAYLLGLSHFKERTFEGWDRAIEQFQLALESDPKRPGTPRISRQASRKPVPRRSRPSNSTRICRRGTWRSPPCNPVTTGIGMVWKPLCVVRNHCGPVILTSCWSWRCWSASVATSKGPWPISRRHWRWIHSISG